MKVNNTQYRTIWVNDKNLPQSHIVEIIDQTKLPHYFVIIQLTNLLQAANAISTMQVRGAPLIGATAAYGVALAMQENSSDQALDHAYERLLNTRPTAINLRWALDRIRGKLIALKPNQRSTAAWVEAAQICDEDALINEAIGKHGLTIIKKLAKKKETVNILTHCNAGWLATVDWGTALSPIYMAHDAGINVHVWVDETRPRNQGASLTAWELKEHGVPHTIIADNTGGHLMQHQLVDMVIVGTDRTTARGDVCNKIGTYLKALAAHDNQVPFYVAVPSSSIDWTINDGIKEIPIEQRNADELRLMTGLTDKNEMATVMITPANSPIANYAFDVTPARLITGLITERGVCNASAKGLTTLYPERKNG